MRQRAMEGWSSADVGGFTARDMSEIGRPHACRVDQSDERLARIFRTVESEIIPRLMLTLGRVAEANGTIQPGNALPGANDVETFAAIVLEHDVEQAMAYLDAMRARGMSLEVVYLDLLAPAARRLGDMWTADSVDFAAVTVALGRLQQIVREVGPSFRSDTESRTQALRALLVPAPGDQHTFGLVMVAEFFVRAGWDVWGGPLSTTEEVVAMVGDEWFDLVGVSLSREGLLDTVAAEIRAIRRASRNQAIAVMVGGPVFTDDPQLAAKVGADATAPDGRVAPVQAERLVERLHGRH